MKDDMTLIESVYIYIYISYMYHLHFSSWGMIYDYLKRLHTNLSPIYSGSLKGDILDCEDDKLHQGLS